MKKHEFIEIATEILTSNFEDVAIMGDYEWIGMTSSNHVNKLASHIEDKYVSKEKYENLKKNIQKKDGD